MSCMEGSGKSADAGRAGPAPGKITLPGHCVLAELKARPTGAYVVAKVGAFGSGPPFPRLWRSQVIGRADSHEILSPLGGDMADE